MTPARYGLATRLLHWLMAGLILAMLFIGAVMTSSLRARPALLDLHVTLGLAILVLALLRLAMRRRGGVPALPASMPRWQVLAARASHLALYGLMLLQPIAGWGMLSAGGFPVTALGGIALPTPIAADPALYTLLRSAHEMIGYAFLAVIVLHVSAALLHALVLRDGVFGQIWFGRKAPE